MNIKKSRVYVLLWQLYQRVRSFLEPITVPISLHFRRKMQEAEIRRIKEKKVYTCAFLVIDDSIWKCDAIYRAMVSSPFFYPQIIVCAVPNGTGYTDMTEKMEKCFDQFKKKGYNVVMSYNIDTRETLDIRELNPDIIVYTKPFKSLIDSSYYIDKLKDKLTVYVPYYINGTNDYKLAYNLPVHNYCWKYYVESPFHKDLARKYSLAKGENVVVSGYPGIEDFINPDYKPTDNWRIKDRGIKRIIWAPHQSIEFSGTVNYSTFLKYCDFMIQLAERHKDNAQFAFKPHPSLKRRLYDTWGKEKTDSYYKKWEEMPNSMISDSDYHDLFLTSDALIHDCGSFTIEYLYLNKPVMRLMNGLDPKTMFGDFGMACINQHTLAYSEIDIECFVEAIINGIDSKKAERTRFIKETLLPQGELPSKVILNDIINSIRK